MTEHPPRTRRVCSPARNPTSGFSVAAREDGSLVVRVHLSLESLAGRPGDDEEAIYDFYAYSVPLRVAPADLVAAAQVWEDDLRPFPQR